MDSANLILVIAVICLIYLTVYLNHKVVRLANQLQDAHYQLGVSKDVNTALDVRLNKVKKELYQYKQILGDD